MSSARASYCLFHRHVLPSRYPVQHRHGMAVRRPLVVARRGDEALLCGCEHAGPHLWPDGDEVVTDEINAPVEEESLR